MKTAKHWFGLVGALIPVLFFGGLFVYFGGVNDASGGVLDSALGSTRVGVGALAIAFGLLFCWRLYRLSRPPTPRKVGPADAQIEEGKSDFDADAAMARYLARRGNGVALRSPQSFASADGDAPRPPAGSFGRKGTYQ